MRVSTGFRGVRVAGCWCATTPWAWILQEYGAIQNKIDVSIDYSTVFNDTIQQALAKLPAA